MEYKEVKRLIKENENAKVEYETKKNRVLAKLEVLKEECIKLEVLVKDQMDELKTILDTDEPITDEFLNKVLLELTDELKDNTNKYYELLEELEGVNL